MEYSTQKCERKFDVFDGVTTDYYDAGHTNLVSRWADLTTWFNARLEAGVDPYSKFTASKIAPDQLAFDRAGRSCSGLNFASQDYLNLSTHPQVITAARSAAASLGVHSAGSAALMGLTELTLRLEHRLARFLGLADVTVFPTGWGAGFGIVKSLVRPGDHVVIDVLAHACLQEGADASGAQVHRFPHCSGKAVERRLARIRQENPRAGILVVTESVFSMDSDVPELAPLQEMCRCFDATLVVDVAHDLGALSADGRGYPGLQGVVGDIDILIGSFSKTFASNGGFVASNRRELKLALRYGCGPLTFTNALSPVQAAAVLAAIDIVESPEGQARRERLLANIRNLRGGLQSEGFEVLGRESAIVPVVLGDKRTSRLMTRHMLQNGAIVNLVEYPAVAKNGCRWRIQVMHDHTPEHIERLIKLATAARESASTSAHTN